MPLPFMKPRKQSAGLIVQTRSPDLSQTSAPEDEGDQGLESCGEDLIRALSSKDAKGVAAALRAAFEILESEPHDEAGSEDYEGSGE